MYSYSLEDRECADIILSDPSLFNAKERHWADKCARWFLKFDQAAKKLPIETIYSKLEEGMSIVGIIRGLHTGQLIRTKLEQKRKEERDAQYKPVGPQRMVRNTKQFQTAGVEASALPDSRIDGDGGLIPRKIGDKWVSYTDITEGETVFKAHRTIRPKASISRKYRTQLKRRRF